MEIFSWSRLKNIFLAILTYTMVSGCMDRTKLSIFKKYPYFVYTYLIILMEWEVFPNLKLLLKYLIKLFSTPHALFFVDQLDNSAPHLSQTDCVNWLEYLVFKGMLRHFWSNGGFSLLCVLGLGSLKFVYLSLYILFTKYTETKIYEHKYLISISCFFPGYSY